MASVDLTRSAVAGFAQGVDGWFFPIVALVKSVAVMVLGLGAIYLSVRFWRRAGKVGLIVTADGFTYYPHGYPSLRENMAVIWRDVVDVEFEPIPYGGRWRGVYVRYYRDGGRDFPADGFARTQAGPMTDAVPIVGTFRMRGRDIEKMLRVHLARFKDAEGRLAAPAGTD